MKTDLFQSCGHCWVFQICWHIECSTFTASSFRIWNSSTGIPSPPLALFVVTLPKDHLTSHSRMSGSRWMITPLWLSGSLRNFLSSFCVYSSHLFFISSAFVALSVLYCAHLCMKCSLSISNSLENAKTSNSLSCFPTMSASLKLEEQWISICSFVTLAPPTTFYLKLQPPVGHKWRACIFPK